MQSVNSSIMPIGQDQKGQFSSSVSDEHRHTKDGIIISSPSPVTSTPLSPTSSSTRPLSSAKNYENVRRERKLVSHNYHDYSTAPPPSTNSVYVTRGGVTTLFPLKLYSLLSASQEQQDGDERVVQFDGCHCALSSVVSWLPHGRAFKVHHIPLFKAWVLPQYFGKMKYRYVYVNSTTTMSSVASSE